MTNKPLQDYNPDKAETEYIYNYDRFSKVSDKLKYPMVESVFLKQSSLINNVWVKKVATLLLRIHSNQTMYDVAISHKPFSSFLLIFDIRFSITILNILDSINRNEFIERLYNWIIRQLLISQIKAIKDRATVPEVPKSTPAINAPEILTPEPKLSIKDYQDLFQIIYLPTIAYQAEQDKVFAAQRVAGANPLVIEELYFKLKKEFKNPEESKQLVKLLKEKFPITNEQYKSIMCCNDTFETAFSEHRLYVTDYQILSEIKTGTVEIKKNQDPVQKFIYNPIALFAIEPGNCPNRRLVPIAIRCYQNLAPDGHLNPLFIAPSIESSEEERWAWEIAKLTVQIADANYHEFISHLGGTHLRMEPIAISIYRKLPKEHPLGALLRPHIEGTLFINDGAVSGLVQPGGTVDKVAAGTLESSLLLSVEGAQNYPFSFNDSSLPNTLKERGVDNTEGLPNYPYRDDALSIWNAIKDWVSNYLNLFYAEDHENSWPKDWIENKDLKIGMASEDITEENSWPKAWIENKDLKIGVARKDITEENSKDKTKEKSWLKAWEDFTEENSKDITKENLWLKSWIENKDLKIAVTADPCLKDWIKDLTNLKEGGRMIGIGENSAEIEAWIKKIQNLTEQQKKMSETEKELTKNEAEIKKIEDQLVAENEENPAKIQTLAYLIEAVTSIIFTGSVQHAAVNFPQSSFMTYMPNMPLAGYRIAPKTTGKASQDKDETSIQNQTKEVSQDNENSMKQHYLDMLPPLCQAENQMNMTHLLGSVHYTTLGDYGAAYFTNALQDITLGAETKESPEKLHSVGTETKKSPDKLLSVETELNKFQAELRAIELKINKKNEARPIHYDFLLPSKIPQSINI